jgi:hypothetical protein
MDSQEKIATEVEALGLLGSAAQQMAEELRSGARNTARTSVETTSW